MPASTRARRCLPTALLLVQVACGNREDPPEDALVFPTDLQGAGFVEVRGCRAPGEHSALAGFTVWVDPDSAPSFEALFAGGGPASMPDGATVVKETYLEADCASGSVDGWLVMQKRAGFDPAGGDWYWQQARVDRTVTTDGKDPGCTGCHQGVASCTGYGADAGLDYLCTAP